MLQSPLQALSAPQLAPFAQARLCLSQEYPREGIAADIPKLKRIEKIPIAFIILPPKNLWLFTQVYDKVFKTMGVERLQVVFLQMVPFLMAIVFHEVAHAFVAKRHGDDTAKSLGRLTLNPIPHIDPIGTLLFPMINMLTGMNLLFGWAKPVPIDYNRLRPYRSGLFLVSLAGPAANVILALFSAMLLVLFWAFVPRDFYLFEPLGEMAKAAIFINYALAIFNLIPLPPLDGSKMVQSFLSYDATRKYESMQAYSFFILLALLWSGGLNILAVPITYLGNLSIGIWVGLLNVVGVPVL
ncbi:MAG: site-2 protease family protein [Bdellovibrionota bacterium]